MKRIFFFIIIFATVFHAQIPPVYVVLFTHIEDNTPAGTLGSPENRQNYLGLRSSLIALGNIFKNYNAKWCFQPDWKILSAALLYEDAAVTQNTNGKNFLRYLKEDLNVTIDPHSHENLGYNYTDVAHLLDSLGVGGSTVIGGHIWDPSLSNFQKWDRFRTPVKGEKYPSAFWRGDILMGSGTPNHVNDPIISGVWRPKDRYNYFVDDLNGNIYCIGQYKGDIISTSELIDLYKNGIVSTSKMLTLSIHIKPADILAANGIAIIENNIIKPMIALVNKSEVVIKDFTSLINDWKSKFNSLAYIYDPTKTTTVNENANQLYSFFLFQNYPNPFNPSTVIGYRLSVANYVTLKIYDLLGKEIITLVSEYQQPGIHYSQFEIQNIPADRQGFQLSSGVYFYTLVAGEFVTTKKLILNK